MFKISPKNPRGELTEALFLRIRTDLMERIDAKVEALKLKHPGRKVSRADVVRTILYDAFTGDA